MRKFRTILPLLFVLLVSIVLGSASFSPEVVQAEQSPGQFHWNLSIKQGVNAAALSANDAGTLQAALSKIGVEARVEAEQVFINGSGAMDQLQSALFDAAPEMINILGGPVVLEIHLPAGGQPLVLDLESRITTGYIWEVMDSSQFDAVAEPDMQSRYDMEGSSAIQSFTLKPNTSAAAVARLIYRRPFEPDEAVRGYLTLSFTQAVDKIEITDPTPLVVTPPEFPEVPEESYIADEALPYALDWRTAGIVPAIRNQGSCGSCWAFATVGAMESAMKKAGAVLPNLSEQFLVDCAYTSSGCDGGYPEHKFHYNTLGLNQSKIGAVLEVDKPYLAYDSYCGYISNHPYRLQNWNFVLDSYSQATTAQMKYAIKTYGPISVSVCAGPGWNYYTGGAYTHDDSYYCNGGTNHAVILVGWNDASNTFILRNSWGSYWGSNGYMYIRYGISSLGRRAAWVKYPSAPPAPTPVEPAVLTNTHYPQYKWTAVPNAAMYEYEVYAGSYRMFHSIQGSSICGPSYCYHRPLRILPDRSYTWRVRANRDGMWGPWSTYKWFSVATNFTYGFTSTSDLTRWNSVYGPWDIFSSNYLRSTGWLGGKNSIVHDGWYPNFTYTVRMMRIGDWGTANAVVVRGTPYPLSSTKDWNKGYYFQYSNTGYFNVLKCNNGDCTMLKNWTQTGAINPMGWNLIQIVGNGPRMEYYINNKLIAIVSDSTFSLGKVGILFAKDNTPLWQPLFVDAAILQTGAATAAPGMLPDAGETNFDWTDPFTPPPGP